MDCLRSDELAKSFDGLKPFSDDLRDEVKTRGIHKVCKNLDKYDDCSLQKHLLVLVTFMDKSLQADPPHLKAFQNYLVELASTIEKAKATTSKDHIHMAMGVLFKYSGALLDVQNDSDEIPFILYSLAYHHLSSVSSSNVEVSAWTALHALETTAALSHSKISDNVLSVLWSRDDLAEYCVDSIIPTEGGIQRLHAGVYREGIANFPGIRSTITVKQMESLFTQLIRFLDRPEVLRLIVWMIGHDERFAEMSLFDKLLSQSTIGKNKDFVHSNLTSVDVKVFLFTLSLWSNSIDCPARIPGRLRLRGNQISCWKAICQLIDNSSTGDMNSVVLRTHVIDSVRLRCRVTSLTRLYGVFCWLEANVGDEDWLTLYATTIYEIITVPPSHRRRCDELFPDGFNDEEDLTVEDVDRIEEHISRYLAAVYLSRGEFREAERRLIYAKSMKSKDLLIKVYQKWVKDGHLNEQERDKLLNLVRELEARCRVSDLHENSPSPSSTDSIESEGDHDVAPAQSPRVQVDVSTNTPNRDVQTSLCDADESFFSVKSDLSDHTLSNCSPGRNNVSNAGSQTSGNTVDGRKVEESKHTGNFTIDEQEKLHSASSMTTSRSVTVNVPEEREKSKEEPLPDIGGGTTSVLRKPTYEMSISAVSSISVIPSQVTTSTSGTATVSNLPPIVANSPFGKFITSKEAAASFWKSGKPPKPVFGTVPPCISSSQQKPEQGNAANMSPIPNTCSSLKGTAQPPASGSICSGTSGTVQSPFSSERSQKNIAGSQDQVPISRSSSKFASNNFMQPHPDVSALEEEFLDDDESFCNNLIIELCKKQFERSPGKFQSTNFADLGALQERMAQIAIQIRNTENQPRTSMPSLPLPPSPSIARTTPTEAQILSEQQQEGLKELEQKVAQLMRPTVQSPKSTVLFMAGDDPVSVTRGSTSGVVSSRSSSHPDRLDWDRFVDPLRRMEQLARHPDSNGVCFGCLDDEGQDRVIKALDRLAYEWNNASDSDGE